MSRLNHTPSFTCGHEPSARRRITDDRVNNFDQLREDCGRFWLAWLLVWPALLAVGCFLLTHVGRSLLLAIWGAA